jgi:hypothetical protein
MSELTEKAAIQHATEMGYVAPKSKKVRSFGGSLALAISHNCLGDNKDSHQRKQRMMAKAHLKSYVKGKPFFKFKGKKYKVVDRYIGVLGKCKAKLKECLSKKCL